MTGAASAQSGNGSADVGVQQPPVDHVIGDAEFPQSDDGQSQFRVAVSSFDLLSHVIVDDDAPHHHFVFIYIQRTSLSSMIPQMAQRIICVYIVSIVSDR